MKVKKIKGIVSTHTYSSAPPPSQENTAGDYTEKSWINKEFLKQYWKLQEEEGDKKRLHPSEVHPNGSISLPCHTNPETPAA